jgi:hypothetical protein
MQWRKNQAISECEVLHQIQLSMNQTSTIDPTHPTSTRTGTLTHRTMSMTKSSLIQSMLDKQIEPMSYDCDTSESDSGRVLEVKCS